jgi:formylaminopyrimidine deformylase / aminopyrimidine aminohydrolase
VTSISRTVLVSDLPQRHVADWTRATQHPFLAAVKDGTLPSPSFATWLVQDYRFVGDLLRFQSRLLARAPRHAQAALSAGVVGLVDELTWFEEQATALGLDLGAPALPVTLGYRRLLERLDAAAVPVALAGLWAVERVYLDAWSFAAPGGHAYREFVAHWTTPAFAAYVDALADAADRALAGVEAPAELDGLFADIARAETGFWDMAWDGGRQ